MSGALPTEVLRGRTPARAVAPANRLRRAGQRAFTLLEILVATAIFAGVMLAIYASWTALLHGAQVAQTAAKETQRSRVAVRALEEGLLAAQQSAFNPGLYAFVADTTEEFAFLSFVAHLPPSFPRAGYYGGLRVRRITFSVEPDENSVPALYLRQTPLLFEPDPGEEDPPLLLARNVVFFQLEFWGSRSTEWEPDWPMTNQLPRVVRFGLASGAAGSRTTGIEGVRTREVVLPNFDPNLAVGLAPPLAPGAPLLTNAPTPPEGLPAAARRSRRAPGSPGIPPGPR